MRRKAPVPKEERPIRRQAFAYRDSWRRPFERSVDSERLAPTRSRLHRIVVPAGRIACGGRVRRRPAAYARVGSHRRCRGGRALAPAPLRNPGAPAGRPPVDQVARPAAEGPTRTARLAAATTACCDPRFETGSRCLRSGQGRPGSRADPLEGVGLGRSGTGQRLLPIRPVSSWLAGAGAPPPRSPI